VTESGMKRDGFAEGDTIERTDQAIYIAYEPGEI